MVIINMRYLDNYYHYRIPGWLLPTSDTCMVITNTKYLDGYYADIPDGPLSAHQQNATRMAFCLRADGGPITDVYLDHIGLI